MSTLLSRPGNLKLSERPQARKGTYFVQTWGCQMNEEDSEQMALALEQIGLQPASSIFEAQVILLNTCSVRRKPEDKAFSLLGELAILKKTKKDMVVGVCGCMAQLRADEIRQKNPHVDFVLGTGDLSQVGGLVEEALQGRRFQKRIHLPERKGAVVDDVPQRLLNRPTKVKAFVPIQYGCDKFCTFCIVPTTRGRERSRATADILEEVTALAANGTKEVTLLGQTVNSYGKNLIEGRVPFSRLLTLLNDVDGLERIRYMSPYPRDFKTDLIEVIRDCPKVMEHVHMPLQGGHDTLLERMHRVYSVDGFLKIVKELRDTVPGVGLTTDVIVGFPGETEEEFQGTLNVLQEVRFDGAYTFIYSPRPGTPAADMEQLPLSLKKERLAQLMELQNRITLQINDTFLGKTLEVLIEGASPRDSQMLQGYSREFKMVHFPGSLDRTGRLAQVRVIGSHVWGLSAELV
jgi:tRNA-2-methylthio-N6-dimethylallyladenosine synthase